MPGWARQEACREAIERTVLGLSGFTLYSVFYFHSDLSETEVEVIGLAPH